MAATNRDSGVGTLGELRAEPPAALAGIERATETSGFAMASEPRTGALLRTLAASKPRGRLLELGTGTGLATAWLLDGMDRDSTLVTVDNDASAVAIAREHLGGDARATFLVADGATCLEQLFAEGRRFGLVFADAWPGKYTKLDLALALVDTGGIYVVDDMLPQPNWPDDHPPRVEQLTNTLLSHPDFHVIPMAWSSGILIATKAH
jgi:predicted O-methyltransferase YrrM